MSSKISNTQLTRKAYVYVRQSTPTQILLHHESTERQYHLRQRALDLGWAPTQIEIIDEDQGRSGQTAAPRSGFQRLVAEVGLGQVGVVLMLEAARLARNHGDWYQLIEICGVSRTLIADEQAVYDPREPNDRLLLGVKGTLSEAELFTLRTRLHEGRWNKAKIGRKSIFLGTVPLRPFTLHIQGGLHGEACFSVAAGCLSGCGYVMGSKRPFCRQMEAQSFEKQTHRPNEGRVDWRKQIRHRLWRRRDREYRGRRDGSARPRWHYPVHHRRRAQDLESGPQKGRPHARHGDLEAFQRWPDAQRCLYS